MSHQKGNWEWEESCRDEDFVNCAFGNEGGCTTHMPHQRRKIIPVREEREDQ